MNVRWRGCLLEIVETVVLTVLIFFLVQHFVAQPYQIMQVSMEDTLQPGQYVLVDKISPTFSDYKRGDVIVFQPPTGFQEDGQDIPFIKRVIGVAGDLVEVHDNAVWVNGVKLNEPYVFDGQPTTPMNGQASWRVPKGDLFVMGDHREASQDSRVFGPIAKSTVIGRAWLRYWPLGKFTLIGSATYQGIPDPPATN
jgi:signal peptidase I